MKNQEPICYPNAIQESLDELEKKREFILRHTEDVHFAEKLVEHFKDLPGCQDWKIWVGWQSGQISGTVVRVEMLDLRETIKIRLWLRNQGFPAPIIEDYPEINRRNFSYYRDDKLSFTLSTFTPWNGGGVCKWVKVGTKEKDVYELHCDGEPIKDEMPS